MAGGLDHDKRFGELGEPSLTVRQIRAVAGLAPVETELAVTTALHRITTGDRGFPQALEALEMRDRIHALAIWTAVMLQRYFSP
ncbi:hypothetical protein O7599_33070 [Streptomyces sp. WMMC500]|uniref:hypothetical protein n=1 Tax=Streptomyces sp. WMMC500 TaxID=3015154 RepID=UPI00248BFCE1|nr:hypothetical protein [Streptomyces sp. WMMC500]WBB60297.1 hypothetical protein O7599_33070 [Streptomyces sp. WMMC500]